MELTTICKLKILPQYVFHNSNPAVFGVRVEGGKLKSQIYLISEKGEKIGRIKAIQENNKPVIEVQEGAEVAISIPGVNFERVLGDRELLYADITESQFKKFKKNKDLLNSSEMKVLQEISTIKKF